MKHTYGFVFQALILKDQRTQRITIAAWPGLDTQANHAKPSQLESIGVSRNQSETSVGRPFEGRYLRGGGASYTV